MLNLVEDISHASLSKKKKKAKFLLFYFFIILFKWHCATNRQAAGSIPDGAIGFFHWHNPFGRTMALGSTQAQTEMSTRNTSWGVKAADA
jgi:hypothetical protein